MVRTQYMRTAFQIPFDSTVRISLDTNLVMIKENPEDGPSCTIAGRYAVGTYAIAVLHTCCCWHTYELTTNTNH